MTERRRMAWYAFILIPLYRPLGLEVTAFHFLYYFFTGWEVLALFLFVASLLKNNENFKIKNKDPFRFLKIYILYSFVISILQKSVLRNDNIKLVSLINFCVNILIVIYFANENYQTLIDFFYGYIFALNILNVLFILISPLRALMPDEHYFFIGHRQSISMIWSLSMFLCLTRYRFFKKKRKKMHLLELILYIGTATFNLIEASIATGTIVFVVYVVLYMVMVAFNKFDRINNVAIYCVYISGFIISYLIIFFNIQEYFSYYLNAYLGESTSMSGRTVIFRAFLEAIEKSKWFGYGQNGVNISTGWGGAWNSLDYAHNTVLQEMANGGIVGLTLFFIAGLMAVYHACKTENVYLKKIILCTLAAQMMIMCSESINNYGFYKLFLVLITYADRLYGAEEAYQLIPGGMESALVYQAGGAAALLTSPAKRRKGFRFVWKMPIWLEEDDGKATGIREENVSFGVFDTLIRRNVARPADLFRIMEQNDPNVPEHFAEKRVEAEQSARAKLGSRMGLADIYEELLPLYGARTNDLMALEIQYEIAGCRPVAENIDLVNLCMEHDKNVFLIADTYLPSSVIRRMLDVCGVYHYDRLYVSCEEGACKADGSLFWKVLADQEIRPSELRHIGSDRQGDVAEPCRVGVHVKRGKKKDQSAVDTELPEETAWYGRTLQACIQNCAADLDGGDARLGCETFGPLLAGFTVWLREQLRRDGVQDVYFLAGDGAVLKQAFDALEDGGFRTHSLYFPEQTAEQDHEALLAYLRACGMQGQVALVDTGRQTIIQKTLEQLIAEAGPDIQVKGYYVGLNADTDGMQAAGYLYEPGQGKETLEKLTPVMAIFDTVFHAQHGAVRRMAMRDGQPVPEPDDYEYASGEGRICDEIAILRAYQAGALTLVREMNDAFPGGVPQIPGEAAILPLLRMGTRPTLQEAELWGDFRVFRDGKAVPMARPKGLGAYLLHPGRLKRDYAASPWKIGFLRRLSRLSLAYEKTVKRYTRNG